MKKAILSAFVVAMSVAICQVVVTFEPMGLFNFWLIFIAMFIIEILIATSKGNERGK